CGGRSASRRSSRWNVVTISPAAGLRMCLLSVRKAGLPSCIGIPWLLAAMRRGVVRLAASRAAEAQRPCKWQSLGCWPARASLFPFPGHHRWRTLTRTSPPRRRAYGWLGLTRGGGNFLARLCVLLTEPPLCIRPVGVPRPPPEPPFDEVPHSGGVLVCKPNPA